MVAEDRSAWQVEAGTARATARFSSPKSPTKSARSGASRSRARASASSNSSCTSPITAMVAVLAMAAESLELLLLMAHKARDVGACGGKRHRGDEPSRSGSERIANALTKTFIGRPYERSAAYVVTAHGRLPPSKHNNSDS